MPKPKDRATKRRTMRDRVKKHAKESRKGTRLLDLSADVDIWYPDEKCTMEMDILPYEVTSKNHPDGIEPGELWYRRPYFIHFIDRKPIVCPKTVGKRCPICEEVERLRKDYETNKELINGLKVREMCLFNFVDPADKKMTVKIFDWSSFKFAQKLEQELDETDDMDDCAFAELDGGSTLKFRISEDSFSGSKYFVTTRLDFRRPRRVYPEDILEKVVNLDECFRIKSYEELVALLTGADEEDEEEKPVQKAQSKKPEPKSKPEPEEDDDDDDDDWDDDDDDDEEPEEKPEPEPEEDDDDDDDDWDDDDSDSDSEDDDEGYLTKADVKEMSKEELLDVIDDNFSDQVKESKSALKRMSLSELRKLVIGLL